MICLRQRGKWVESLNERDMSVEFYNESARLLTFTFRVTKGSKLGSVFAKLNLKLTASAKWQNLHFGFELAPFFNRFHGNKIGIK